MIRVRRSLVVLATTQHLYVAAGMERNIFATPAAATLVVVGKVKARATMATIHHRRQFTALREVLDEYFKQLVVRNLPGALVVARHDRLVVAVGLSCPRGRNVGSRVAAGEVQDFAERGGGDGRPDG